MRNIDYHQVDWDYLLKKGEENKVLLPLVQNLLTIHREIPENAIEKLQLVLNKGERLFQQWRETLNFILGIFREKSIDALLIKSLKGYPHCSVDLDFLLKDKKSFRKAISALKQKDYMIYTADDKHKLCCMNNLGVSSTEIDLYSKITWRNVHLTFFDYEQIWNRRETTKDNGVEIPTPSVEDDMLITCAHSVFGHHYYFLGDLFYLASVFKKKNDFQYMFTTAKKFGWSLALYYFLCYSNILYQRFYNRTIIPHEILDSVFGGSTAIRLIDTFLQRKNVVTRFPCRYPTTFEFLATIEKGVSNLSKHDLAAMYKEASSMAIDSVHTLMSDVYGFFISRLRWE